MHSLALIKWKCPLQPLLTCERVLLLLQPALLLPA
jgi:hypothetical protein